jgi:hypothetical protein
LDKYDNGANAGIAYNLDYDHTDIRDKANTAVYEEGVDVRGKYAPAPNGIPNATRLGLVYNPLTIDKTEADFIENPTTLINGLTIIVNDATAHNDKRLAAKMAIALRQDDTGTA